MVNSDRLGVQAWEYGEIWFFARTLYAAMISNELQALSYYVSSQWMSGMQTWIDRHVSISLFACINNIVSNIVQLLHFPRLNGDWWVGRCQACEDWEIWFPFVHVAMIASYYASSQWLSDVQILIAKRVSIS
jgi:hypothetical protein